MSDRAIVFCNPPPRTKRAKLANPFESEFDPPFRWEEHLMPLMARPGEWARVDVRYPAVRARRQVGQLNGGYIAGIDPTDWEFVSRTLEDRSGGIWARYIGTKEIE